MIKPALFVDCDCENGERWYETKELKELKVCHICRGKGKLVVSEGFVKYQMALLSRCVDYCWKILKHQTPLPSVYFYILSKPCEKCDYGYWWEKINDKLYKKVHCTCNNGIIAPRVKDVYDTIFQEYLEYKEYRKQWKEIIKDKEYFKEEYRQQYEPIRVEGHKWICVRCANFLDGTEDTNDTCNGCANETGYEENESYFVPHTDRSMRWYDRWKYRFDIAYKKEVGEDDLSKMREGNA